MFQSFSETADPSRGVERVALLRAELKRRGLDGFVVPRADEHQGEYVPPSAARLAWLTGFTGSAGSAVILADHSAIFVDGRYTLQVREQVDPDVFQPVAVAETSVSEWLRSHAPANGRIGYDPWLLTRAQVRSIARALETAGVAFVAVESNPVDAIWADRPPAPLAAVTLHDDALAGQPAAEKSAVVAQAIVAAGADAAVLTDPSSLAWLLNIRGGDVPHTPLPLGFALVPKAGRPELFIDGRKLSNSVRDAIEDAADVRQPGDFTRRLGEIGAAKGKVLFDAHGSAEAVAGLIEAAGGTLVDGPDPAALPRARKNAAELAGSRAAHQRDGIAMLRFLLWLEESAPGSLTEIDAAMRLEAFRVAVGEESGVPLEEISFDTISSTGPNAAINHYRVTGGTNRRLEPGDLYLVDSGAQYRDGTTDITRTLLVGTASPDRLSLYRDRYTRVLKGHIAIARATFAKSTTGAHIDSFARAALWRAGLDFDHGTGHGVGSYLSVHEGPLRIARAGHHVLDPGMILSNEPGYYSAGDFGIRIENLIAVREAEIPPGGNRAMLSFETLTLTPLGVGPNGVSLVNLHLLDAAEIAWLNVYHQRVFGTLSGWPTLTKSERQWLEAACSPLLTL